MPVIRVDSYAIREVAVRWQRFQRVTIELREEIQYRLLGEADFQPYIGSVLGELQMLLRQLNQEEMLIAAQIRELYGWADQVDGTAGGFGLPPSFLQPRTTFRLTYPAQTAITISRFRSWSADPVSVRWLGSFVFAGRRAPAPRPFDWDFSNRSWVNRLAQGGTYVNVV
jgi:hypothetical protein